VSVLSSPCSSMSLPRLPPKFHSRIRTAKANSLGSFVGEPPARITNAMRERRVHVDQERAAAYSLVTLRLRLPQELNLVIVLCVGLQEPLGVVDHAVVARERQTKLVQRVGAAVCRLRVILAADQFHGFLVVGKPNHQALCVDVQKLAQVVA